MAILSELTESKIRGEVARYSPHVRTALLPSLKHAQAELGWLPAEAIARVADLVGVPHSAAAELSHFYSMLHTDNHGRVYIEVCVQLPCAVAGAERLLRWLSEDLDVAPGETTADGIRLERTAECFGSCHRAPMCRVNDDYHEHLDRESARRLVETVRDELRTTGGGLQMAGAARGGANLDGDARDAGGSGAAEG
ncbi:MAG: NAD(P)H-dependent oxidoreductase subunit E [Chloroflexota bacterium]